MKRIVALLLTLVMCLALVACESADAETEIEESSETAEETPTMTKEEMQAQAVDADVTTINNESFENLARAKMNYCNKILNLTGTIMEVKEDHVVLGTSTYVVDVFLPLEELVEVNAGQQIVVVGQTSDEIIESSDSIGEFAFEYIHYQMPVAYLAQDRFEITGILKGVNNSYAPVFNIQIGTSNVLKLIYFADSVDTSALEFGQEITFTAKCVQNSMDWKYMEAEIVG